MPTYPHLTRVCVAVPDLKGIPATCTLALHPKGRWRQASCPHPGPHRGHRLQAAWEAAPLEPTLCLAPCCPSPTTCSGRLHPPIPNTSSPHPEPGVSCSVPCGQELIILSVLSAQGSVSACALTGPTPGNSALRGRSASSPPPTSRLCPQQTAGPGCRGRVASQSGQHTWGLCRKGQRYRDLLPPKHGNPRHPANTVAYIRPSLQPNRPQPWQYLQRLVFFNENLEKALHPSHSSTTAAHAKHLSMS